MALLVRNSFVFRAGEAYDARDKDTKHDNRIRGMIITFLIIKVLPQLN